MIRVMIPLFIQYIPIQVALAAVFSSVSLNVQKQPTRCKLLFRDDRARSLRPHQKGQVSSWYPATVILYLGLQYDVQPVRPARVYVEGH